MFFFMIINFILCKFEQVKFYIKACLPKHKSFNKFIVATYSERFQISHRQ